MTHRPFLTAQWRHLAMLNWVVEPGLLAKRVPLGTELDLWQGRAYLSVVGFLFRDTRVLGLGVPFHRHFEEVNLRFYVRRRAAEGWRRGVVFVKEIVPRAAIAWVARALYNENYVALPMSHAIVRAPEEPREVVSVAYGWTLGRLESQLALSVASAPQPLATGSEEEFVAEHYWGYSRQRDGGTVEYAVTHPPWRVAAASEAELGCDAGRLYGAEFAAPLQAPPVSAFLAEGSEVTVSHGVRIEG